MKLFEKPSLFQRWLLIPVFILALQGCSASTTKPMESAPKSEIIEESVPDPVSLMGEWCYIKKKRVTKYNVKEGVLDIRSGRSGQAHKADLSCNDDYTVCEAKTMRGWQTPVTETLRLDGKTMKLTRIWGGSWKGKTYNFTYTRCPKW